MAEENVALLEAVVPESLRGEAYLADIIKKPQAEAFPELFKKLDGAQKLIGKKNGIPEGEKPEDWTPFLEKMRPAKADDYEIALGANPDQEFVADLRGAMHGAGIHKIQANKFLGALIPKFQAREAKLIEARKAQDLEFENLKTATFGADGAKVMERVRGALDEYTPKVLQPHLQKLDNNALTIVAGVINAILEKYVPEDKMPKGKAPPAGGGADIREEGRKLMASPAYTDASHKEHAATVKRVNEIYSADNFKK